jgi:hypothetical protein
MLSTTSTVIRVRIGSPVPISTSRTMARFVAKPNKHNLGRKGKAL